MQEPRPVGNSR